MGKRDSELEPPSDALSAAGRPEPFQYDSVLVVSFGGPEGPADVLPFLENVLRGKNIPVERKLAVAEHYQHFGGVSPLNAENRALVAALQAELDAHGPRLRVFWGNRNWHPLLSETLAQMASAKVRRVLAFFTSAYSSYSSCRQYRENIEAARQLVGVDAPQVDKLRAYFNHPGFIGPMTERVHEALRQVPVERRASARIIYTAHSIPSAMAERCDYAKQLHDAARLVSEGVDASHYELAYQSRSGPPGQAWLEPDIGDALRKLASSATMRDVIIAPLGFLSDHIEILWDLDIEARAICGQLGLNMVRAATVGTHPGFVGMIRELISERVAGAPKRVMGNLPASHDDCPADCCLYPAAAKPS